MKKSLFLLLMLVPLLLSAQKLKKVKTDTERFTVLKSNNSIKQGLYRRYWDKKTVVEEGFYRNGQKDSIWTTFNIWNGSVISRGYYKGGEKAGIWEYYSSKDELEYKYDYSTKTVTFCKTDTITYRILIGPDTLRTKLDCPPLYIGGKQVLKRTLQDSIDYPRSARDNGIDGKVLIAFIIDSTGRVSGHKIYKSVDPDLDKAALRAAKALAEYWIPASFKGRAVNLLYILPITFVLEH
jgi:periplasmic protein TonB